MKVIKRGNKMKCISVLMRTELNAMIKMMIIIKMRAKIMEIMKIKVIKVTIMKMK